MKTRLCYMVKPDYYSKTFIIQSRYFCDCRQSKFHASAWLEITNASYHQNFHLLTMSRLSRARINRYYAQIIRLFVYLNNSFIMNLVVISNYNRVKNRGLMNRLHY